MKKNIQALSWNGQPLNWYVLSDEIMGGHSKGNIQINNQKSLVLTADIDTNGGGFCAFNTIPLNSQLLPHHGDIQAIVIDATIHKNTDIRAIKVCLAKDEFAEVEQGVWASILTPPHQYIPGTRTRFNLPLTRFKHTYRGPFFSQFDLNYSSQTQNKSKTCRCTHKK